MSEPKFTSGEWLVVDHMSDWGMPKLIEIRTEETIGKIEILPIAEIISITPYCAGATIEDKKLAETASANARLIGQAPRMYHALKEVLSFLTTQQNFFPEAFNNDELIQRIDKILKKVDSES